MQTSATIIPALPAHTEAILQITVDAGMFQAEEIGALREILEGFHAAPDGNGQHIIVSVDSNDNAHRRRLLLPQPHVRQRLEPMDDHRATRSTMPRHRLRLHRPLRKHHPTSGWTLANLRNELNSQIRKNRTFYVQRGYAHVWCITNYYGDEEDKIIFCKRIAN
jgi:hypothetical protein